MAPGQQYYGKAAAKRNWRNKNQARFQHIQLPSNIKCYVCDQVKPANVELYSYKTLSRVKQAIAEADDRDEFRARLEKESTDEAGFSCILCSNRSRTEMQCKDCELWLGLDSFSKAQRKLWDEAKCKDCMNEHLARGSVEDQMQSFLQDKIKEAKKQRDMELASAVDDDDNADAKTIISDVATVGSATVAWGASWGASDSPESESDWSVQTPFQDANVDVLSAQDDFVEVKSYNHKRACSNSNSNNWHPHKGWNRYNSWNSRSGYHSNSAGPKTHVKTNAFAKRSDWQKPKIPMHMGTDEFLGQLTHEEINDLAETYLDKEEEEETAPALVADPVTGIKW